MGNVFRFSSESFNEDCKPNVRHGEARTIRPRNQLLAKLETTGSTGTGEPLRTSRAIEVLERIAAPEARQLLTKLAAGAPGAEPTREAKAALERLTKRGN
jgi:hypothetical protein